MSETIATPTTDATGAAPGGTGAADCKARRMFVYSGNYVSDGERTFQAASPNLAAWLCDVLNKRKENDHDRIAELEGMLSTCEDAINSLDEDALGYANDGDHEWPNRDELLSNIERVLSNA